MYPRAANALADHDQGLIEPPSGERACNSRIAKYLLLLKLEVTPTNCRRREKKAVANDETTVPPSYAKVYRRVQFLVL